MCREEVGKGEEESHVVGKGVGGHDSDGSLQLVLAVHGAVAAADGHTVLTEVFAGDHQVDAAHAEVLFLALSISAIVH